MRQSGRIARLVHQRGFGFIQRGPGAKDMFFHFTAFSDAEREVLAVGMRVEFEAGVDNSGRSCAERAKVVG
jgi:cold shock CspA family protein